MNNNVKLGIAGLVIFAVGYGTALLTRPAKVITKTQTITQTHDIIHDHIHTVVVTKPDGTKTTTTDDNSVINDNSSTKDSSSTITTYSKPQWKVGALAGLSVNSLSKPIYGAQVEKRLLGPISIGAFGLSNSTGGVSLSLEF